MFVGRGVGGYASVEGRRCRRCSGRRDPYRAVCARGPGVEASRGLPAAAHQPELDNSGRWLYGLGERMPARALDHNLTAPAVPRTLRSTPSWMVWPIERRPTVHRAEAPTAPVAGTAPPSLGERRCRRAEHPTHVPQIIWPPRVTVEPPPAAGRPRAVSAGRRRLFRRGSAVVRGSGRVSRGRGRTR
jgi:hypothetical protein